MQAIILAAGMGKRLKELTQDNTKCMVKVDGISLIERALGQLDRLGLSKIVIVVGYEGQKLIDYIGTLAVQTPVVYINNEIYDKTNNIYSLALAKEYLLKEDTLLLESDIIFEEAVLRALVDDPRDTLALVDKYERWMDGTVVKLDEEDRIIEFVPGKKFKFSEQDSYYKTVNLYKFSREFARNRYVPFLEAYQKALGNNEYYEQVLSVISILDEPVIKAKRLHGERWYEIDDVQDLDIATTLFAESEDERVSLLGARYGGYWRYPKLLDFCYLVNPYFPPQKLKDELQANFDVLLTQYPSGMRVNALLAAKNFAVRPEHIVVGNGAAELIKEVMEQIGGNFGVIRPTFEEYPNRFPTERSVIFVPQTEDFSYTAEDVIAYFTAHPISCLVMINPDNPTGNYLDHGEQMKLLTWCDREQITLIWDESFSDFADEQDNQMLTEELLEQYPKLIVVKSISKSYGVPGLRLGVLASGNETLIADLKKRAVIWNINSFAEYYMQIAEKYKKDYVAAMEKFREERAWLAGELEQIAHMRVYPTQANYFMVELLDGRRSGDVVRELLVHEQILLKDLTGKIKCGDRQFLRIAIRNRVENERMVRALENILK